MTTRRTTFISGHQPEYTDQVHLEKFLSQIGANGNQSVPEPPNLELSAIRWATEVHKYFIVCKGLD